LKILFAIQGTGNGHLSRARDVYPELLKYGTVDVLVSGIQADVATSFPVKYKFYGMSFIFGKSGGVSIPETLKKTNLGQLLRDIGNLDVKAYDLVINDFEPVSAWACKRRGVPCISLSHQSAVINPASPKPAFFDLVGPTVLKYYAPVTAAYGFHFKQYAKNISTPVIRKEVRDLHPVDKGHYTVYLPAYDDETLVKNLSHFSDVTWHVFSKHNKEPFTHQNVQVAPIQNEAFINSMEQCTGVLCGAGFEGPAEALYLGKKLMVIPMDGQYEQHCNAAAIKELGVPVLKRLSLKYADKIKWWLMNDERVRVNYPDNIADVVAQLMKEHAPASTLHNMAVTAAV
jgi:uncharacterized protein (TIGR00661 family)